MVKIVIVTRNDCIACDVVKKVILDATEKIDTDVIIKVVKNNDDDIVTHGVKVFPTTVFYKYDKTCHTYNRCTVAGQGWLEIARLEGSFPIDYLNKVIDKLKLEQ